jgi:hypothetical protein
MFFTTSDGNRTPVHCERCGLGTPSMSVASEKAAGEILRAAGWSVHEAYVLCPRCRSRPYPAAYARRAETS